MFAFFQQFSDCIGGLLLDVTSNVDEAGVGRLIFRKSGGDIEDLGDKLRGEVKAPASALPHSAGPVVGSANRLWADSNPPSQRVRGTHRDISWGVHGQAGTRNFLHIGLSELFTQVIHTENIADSNE